MLTSRQRASEREKREEREREREREKRHTHTQRHIRTCLLPSLSISDRTHKIIFRGTHFLTKNAPKFSFPKMLSLYLVGPKKNKTQNSRPVSLPKIKKKKKKPTSVCRSAGRSMWSGHRLLVGGFLGLPTFF